MIIDRYRSELTRLGIPPHHPEILKLLPATMVAWASGTMESLQRLRLLRLAHDHLGLGPEADEVLGRWLTAPPEHGEAGLALLVQLARAEDEGAIDTDELADMVAWSEWVARGHGTAADAPWAVAEAEDATIARVADLLGVDLGKTWASLWHELHASHDDAPISGPVPVGSFGQVPR